MSGKTKIVPPFRKWTLILAVMVITGVLAAFSSVAFTWRTVQDTNSPTARHESAYVEVNGKFYLLGGRGAKRIQIYNPADSTWTNGDFAPNSTVMHHFQAVAIGNIIYVIGAYNGTYPDETALPNIYTYNTSNGNWSQGFLIPEEFRRASAGVVAYNNKIYVVGGSTGGHGTNSVRSNRFDEYNPSNNTWTALDPAPRARDHVQAAVVGSRLYVIGGRNGDLNTGVSEVDVYNFNTEQWSTLPSGANIPTKRSGATTVALGNFVVVIGGESNTQVDAHAEAEALNVNSNSWISLGDLVTGRHGTQAVTYNNDIYIVAGAGERGGAPELSSQEVLETGGLPLPVELDGPVEALVNEKNILLQWRTLSEFNNAGFEVQMELNGTFEPVGYVQGAGTTAEMQEYSYQTTVSQPGTYRFRLKQIDFDGTFELTDPVQVQVQLVASYSMSKPYPNPFNPEARFELTVARSQLVSIQVVDALGRFVSTIYEGPLEAGAIHPFTIQASQWPTGLYLIQARGETFVTSRPLVLAK